MNKNSQNEKLKSQNKQKYAQANMKKKEPKIDSKKNLDSIKGKKSK